MVRIFATTEHSIGHMHVPTACPSDAVSPEYQVQTCRYHAALSLTDRAVTGFAGLPRKPKSLAIAVVDILPCSLVLRCTGIKFHAQTRVSSPGLIIKHRLLEVASLQLTMLVS